MLGVRSTPTTCELVRSASWSATLRSLMPRQVPASASRALCGRPSPCATWRSAQTTTIRRDGHTGPADLRTGAARTGCGRRDNAQAHRSSKYSWLVTVREATIRRATSILSCDQGSERSLRCYAPESEYKLANEVVGLSQGNPGADDLRLTVPCRANPDRGAVSHRVDARRSTGRDAGRERIHEERKALGAELEHGEPPGPNLTGLQ